MHSMFRILLCLSFSAGLCLFSATTHGASVKAGLFRVGIGGYLSNGSSYCVFKSNKHLTECGFKTTDNDKAPMLTALPATMRNDGACSCDAAHPWTVPAGLF